jgi:hypothetical protein
MVARKAEENTVDGISERIVRDGFLVFAFYLYESQKANCIAGVVRRPWRVEFTGEL